MIRCNESVLAELQVRGCAPLEGFCLALRMSMWPAFQNEMNNHVDSLKRLADGATGGILSRGVIKEGTIQLVSLYASSMDE